MSTITALKAQKNKKRVNIYLDDKFGFGLDLEEAVKRGLKVGQGLEQSKIDQLVYTDQKLKLYQKALNYLSFRPRSQKEITDYLKKNLYKLQSIELNLKQEIIDKIINKLKNKNLINDDEFCRWWVGQRFQFRPRGKRFLSLELRQKGIDKTIIDQVLSSLDQTEWRKLALKIVAKKIRILKNLPKIKIKQKLFNLLISRGFDYPLVKKVIDENLEK